jgi:DNA-binding GntR family transcriptional regulator
MTARDAIRQLTNEGIVVSRQGKGAYVVRTPDADDNTPADELLDLLHAIRTSVDDLTDRMAVVEKKLADRDQPTEPPPPQAGH